MSNVIFLNYGLVKTYMEGEKKDLILKIVPSNHFIGLSSFFENNNTFIHSTSAFIDSKVTLIDIDIFSQILHSNSKFAFKIISILNSNAAQVYGRFYCLTCKQAHGKVADLLLCLADRVFKEDIFNLPISRNDFAELLGISMESVIRIFKQLKDEKLISIKGSTFNIIDKVALNKISNFG
jgi:CRP/FNR family transcriptional regulator